MANQAEINQLFNNIDPYEFEQLVADIWENHGYETTVTQGSQDKGIDVRAHQETPVEQELLIQAKAYSEDNKVGSEEVQRYSALKQQEDADSVAIVTTSSFTKQARELADDLDVKLIDRESLTELVDEDTFENHSINKTTEAKNESVKDADDWLDLSKDVYDEFQEQLEKGLNIEITHFGKPEEYSNCCVCGNHDSIWGFQGKTLEDDMEHRGRACYRCHTVLLNFDKEDWILHSSAEFDTDDMPDWSPDQARLETWMNIVPDEGIYAPHPINSEQFDLKSQPTPDEGSCPVCRSWDCVPWFAETTSGEIIKWDSCETIWVKDSRGQWKLHSSDEIDEDEISDQPFDRGSYEEWMNINPEKGIYSPHPIDSERFELSSQPIPNKDWSCPICGNAPLWFGVTESGTIAKCDRDRCGAIWRKGISWWIFEIDRVWKCIDSPEDGGTSFIFESQLEN